MAGVRGRDGEASVAALRDENGAESFRLFRGKTKIEQKNGNKNGKNTEWKQKRNFFCGNGNKNGTAVSGGTVAETAVSVAYGISVLE
jgi:hypothetical protein